MTVKFGALVSVPAGLVCQVSAAANSYFYQQPWNFHGCFVIISIKGSFIKSAFYLNLIFLRPVNLVLAQDAVNTYPDGIKMKTRNSEEARWKRSLTR